MTIRGLKHIAVLLGMIFAAVALLPPGTEQPAQRPISASHASERVVTRVERQVSLTRTRLLNQTQYTEEGTREDSSREIELMYQLRVLFQALGRQSQIE